MIPPREHPTNRPPYLPALDGLRALARLAVMCFHADFSWAKGGHLGVTTFFVLSGFLITALLLVEHDQTGRINLLAFWARRARRLVPAALLTVGLVVAYVALLAERVPKDLLADGIAALFWVANWRFIGDGAAYDDMFEEPSPFRHFWSLAVEEQFYLLFPLIVIAVFGLARTAIARRVALAAAATGVVDEGGNFGRNEHRESGAVVRTQWRVTDARLAEPMGWSDTGRAPYAQRWSATASTSAAAVGRRTRAGRNRRARVPHGDVRRPLEEWPSWMKPGDPIFNTWLIGEYRALIDTVTSRQIAVLLVNAPCADWTRIEEFGQIERADDRVHALNRAVYHEISTSATRVVDLSAYLCPGRLQRHC